MSFRRLIHRRSFKRVVGIDGVIRGDGGTAWTRAGVWSDGGTSVAGAVEIEEGDCFAGEAVAVVGEMEVP